MEKKQQFKFLTNTMKYEELGTKGGKKYYVTGYISTDEVDRANEIVTKGCMKSMLQQIKTGNVKLDVEHSTFTGENDIPVGKILDADIDDTGLWVKAEINRHHEKFKSIWNSVQEGFLDAFSIAYNVLDYANEVINGGKVTILKSIELLNVAITGNPVNRGAKMTESFYKSTAYMKNMEETKMSEEEVKIEETQEAAPVVEETVEKPAEEAKEEVKTEEPVVEETAEPKEEVKEEVPEANPMDEIKSLEKQNAQLKATIKDLGAKMDKFEKALSKPKLKGLANTEKRQEVKELKSMLSLIN